MAELASFMHGYNMRGQHTADRSMTRYKHDVGKMVENNEISTGPGRWALGVPNAYGNAAYVPDVTTINQKWGASHIMTSTKTDVESDLKNLSRPTVRTTCGQYQPQQGAALAAQLKPMPEASFPQTASHLVDPPCTLRGTGINRWQWLCENPQENVMVPFEHLVDSRHASKDAVYSKITQPIANSPLVRDRQMLCSTLYVDPAVPVARPRGPNEPLTFNDTVPGASQRPPSSGALPPSGEAQRPPSGEAQRLGSTPVYRETPRGAPPQGRDHPDAPSRWLANPAERERAQTGVIAPPPPFTDYIARH